MVRGEVDKVLIVSDRKYQLKADAREGGVGEEFGIIINDVINKMSQDRVALVAIEKDSNGKECVPIALQSRLRLTSYIGRSNPFDYDEILRWAHDKQLYPEPPLQNIPDNYFDRKKQIIGFQLRDQALESIEVQQVVKRLIDWVPEQFLLIYRLNESDINEFASELDEECEEFFLIVRKLFRFVSFYSPEVLFRLVRDSIETCMAILFEKRLRDTVLRKQEQFALKCLTQYILIVFGVMLEAEELDELQRLLRYEYSVPNTITIDQASLANLSILVAHNRYTLGKKVMPAEPVPISQDLEQWFENDQKFLHLLFSIDMLMWLGLKKKRKEGIHIWMPTIAMRAGYRPIAVFQRARNGDETFQEFLAKVSGYGRYPTYLAETERAIQPLDRQNNSCDFRRMLCYPD